jgi:hypothetical protein
MPQYFIYKIEAGANDIVKSLTKLNQFDKFRDAKQEVKRLRREQSSDDAALFKVIFAENELQAEEMLQEKREAPVVLEWEK